MKDTPINYDIVKNIIKESPIMCIGKASIREIKKLINDIEKKKDMGIFVIKIPKNMLLRDRIPKNVKKYIAAYTNCFYSEKNDCFYYSSEYCAQKLKPSPRIIDEEIEKLLMRR